MSHLTVVCDAATGQRTPTGEMGPCPPDNGSAAGDHGGSPSRDHPRRGCRRTHGGTPRNTHQDPLCENKRYRLAGVGLTGVEVATRRGMWGGGAFELSSQRREMVSSAEAGRLLRPRTQLVISRLDGGIALSPAAAWTERRAARAVEWSTPRAAVPWLVADRESVQQVLDR
jgi:hypothetical protein